MKGASEATVVEARFEATGEITPRRFAWRGRMLTVEGVGRRRQEGRERCFDVMAAGGQQVEFGMGEETFCWQVIPLSSSRRAC